MEVMTGVEMTENRRPPKVKPYGPRAPSGAAEVGFNLRLTEMLHKRALKSARQQGVTLSEWIRGAMLSRLNAEADA